MSDDPKDFSLVTGPARPRPPLWLPDEIGCTANSLHASFDFRFGTQHLAVSITPVLQPDDDAAEVFRKMLDRIWHESEMARLRAQGARA